VEHAVSRDSNIEECTVYGVEVEGAGGKAGMAAIQLKGGADFDGKALAKTVYENLPSYALPLFVRVVDELEKTSTHKTKKVDLSKQGYGSDDIDDPVYVLKSRDEGYVEYYDDYPEEVKAGKAPKSK
jgi:fatty-acyl-CoA synthase